MAEFYVNHYLAATIEDDLIVLYCHLHHPEARVKTFITRGQLESLAVWAREQPKQPVTE